MHVVPNLNGNGRFNTSSPMWSWAPLTFHETEEDRWKCLLIDEGKPKN